MKILCSVCARGGSTTLKNKNIKKLYGKPLILHTLMKAKKSGAFACQQNGQFCLRWRGSSADQSLQFHLKKLAICGDYP